jgi:hypothetical protein
MTAAAARRHRWTDAPMIPNPELSWFICCSASLLREKGGYGEGFTSHGEPDPCPFTDAQLGFAKRYGEGQIERAGECCKAWHAIGEEHRATLAAYYSARLPGSVDPDGSSAVVDATSGQAMGEVVRAMGLTPTIAKAARGNMAISGVMRLMAATSDKDLVNRANRAVSVAHTIWEMERIRLEKPSSVRFRTGELEK